MAEIENGCGAMVQYSRVNDLASFSKPECLVEVERQALQFSQSHADADNSVTWVRILRRHNSTHRRNACDWQPRLPRTVPNECGSGSGGFHLLQAGLEWPGNLIYNG